MKKKKERHGDIAKGYGKSTQDSNKPQKVHRSSFKTLAQLNKERENDKQMKSSFNQSAKLKKSSNLKPSKDKFSSGFVDLDQAESSDKADNSVSK